jgi:guanylate cyclase
MTQLNGKLQIPAITRIGSQPGDSEEVQLQKSLLVISTTLIGIAGFLWGLIYLYFDEPIAASIPLVYSFLSFLGLAIFAFYRQYQFFRFSQLLLTLLLPFLLLVALGGFVNSSAVILWSLTCPLGAMLFYGRRQAIPWFVVYLILVLFSLLLSPFLRQDNNLPPSVVMLFFVLNISAVSLVAFILLQYFVRQKDRALELLGREQEKSELLLLNVLPKEVVTVLKDEVRTIADYVEEVSVLFADVVDFTPLTTELAPMEMVSLLDEAFSYFDELVEKNDLEKVRTIGDNYMVAAGAPRRRPDHAHILAKMALSMNSFVPRNGRSLKFRIGINSGPVIAGVIGTTKFHYDLWGDTVNTASRMESHGLPGKIQITRTTRDLIKDDFVCSRRGMIEIKGKGAMETWLLED